MNTDFLFVGIELEQEETEGNGDRKQTLFWERSLWARICAPVFVLPGAKGQGKDRERCKERANHADYPPPDRAAVLYALIAGHMRHIFSDKVPIIS